MHLLQRRRVGLEREGHVTGDVGDQDDPYGVVEIDAELATPGEDHPQRDDRTGHRERQHAEEFQEALATHLHLDDDVGNDHSSEHGDQRCGEAQADTVPDRATGQIPAEQDVVIVVPGQVFQGEGQAIGLQAADQENRHRGQHDGEADIGDAQDQHRDAQAAQLEFGRAEALAGDDLVLALGQYPVLQPEDDRRRDHQHRGQHCRRADRFKTAGALVDLFVDQRRDVVDTGFDTKHGHRTEVCHRVKHDQQRPGEDRRQDQRDGDLARDGEEIGSGNPRRFFQRRIHAFQRAGDLDENEGEEVHRLDQDDPGVGVDIEDRAVKTQGVHEKAVDVASTRREQHLPGECADEGGQHEGHQEQELHGFLERQIGARHQPGKEGADEGAGDRHATGQNQRIQQRLIGFLAPQHPQHVGDVEVTIDPEGIEKDQQHGDGNDHHQHADREHEEQFGRTEARFFS